MLHSGRGGVECGRGWLGWSNPEPSTLNPQPSTLNPQPCTLNPEPAAPRSSLSGCSHLSGWLTILTLTCWARGKNPPASGQIRQLRGCTHQIRETK
ncbi:hypothetical protein T484DRAFT_2360366 [Baffinella frigidus]|nr:hypothetical protein T484DRAFT_2360366 [Cryptophyta sp. CCMP2293]